MPDEFRTMAACEALGTLFPVFERYDSLVTLVMKELLRSVYEVLPKLVERDSLTIGMSRSGRSCVLRSSRIYRN